MRKILRRFLCDGKIVYRIAMIISLAALEFGLLCELTWFWSGFPWSPFGYETCGLEWLIVVVFAWPQLVGGVLIRLFLLAKWRYPHYVWYLPLLLCAGISSVPFKSLAMGVFCIVFMLILPVVDVLGGRGAQKREKQAK